MSGEEEKYEGLEPENVSNNNSFISSKLSLDDEKILLGRIYKTGLGMIFPCILIMFTSTYAFIESSNKVLLLPAIISVFALFFICLLCYLSRESKLSGTKAPDLLFLCLYFIHFSAAAYFALGILLVFMFGFQTSISYWVSVSILCIEGATTKYLFGYGLIFVFFRKLAIEHHTIQNYLQVMQITLFLCGAGICMTCLAYRSSWLNIDLHYQVPPVILTLGILAGSLLSVLSILLFYAAYAEKLSLLLLCQIFNVVLMIFIFLYGSMVRYSNKLYEEIIKFNCSYILKILNYEMFSCQKYIESDECGKQFIATVWEDGLDPGTRCLNINCCEELEENITLYLEFLMIWAILVFILMVFSFLAGQGLVKKIEKFGKSPERKLDIQLLSVMVIIVLLSLAGWFTFDHGQQKLTRNEPIVSVLNGEILDSTLIPSDLCEKVEVEIKEFSGVSEVKLSSFDGDFSQNFFVGKYKKVQSQIDHSQFYPRFPKEIYVVEVNVTSDDV